MLLASYNFQQFTSSIPRWKGGLTARYIIIVPILGLFLKKKCSPVIVGAVGLSVVGLYLLCMVWRGAGRIKGIC